MDLPGYVTHDPEMYRMGNTITPPLVHLPDGSVLQYDRSFMQKKSSLQTDDMTDDECSSWLNEWQSLELFSAQQFLTTMQGHFKQKCLLLMPQTYDMVYYCTRQQNIQELQDHLGQAMDIVMTIRHNLQHLINAYLGPSDGIFQAYLNTGIDYGQALIMCLELEPDAIVMDDVHEVTFWQLWAMEAYLLHAVHSTHCVGRYPADSLKEQQQKCFGRYCSAISVLMEHPQRHRDKKPKMSAHLKDLALAMRRIQGDK